MFERVTLEVSLKPFFETSDEYIRLVCERILEDWRPLLRGRRTISVMLWASDGSEILDYTGEPDLPFEWCQYVGTANGPSLAPAEPRYLSLHKRRQLYTEKPARMTYRTLKKIVQSLKQTGRRLYPDAVIEVGETFDIGPEFAVSDFKYRRHTEITSGAVLDKCGFVDATARLAADDRLYAAYPNGIPEGTPFGTFLGKQAQIFLSDMGFDYLWLSNGLGFSANPWELTGKIFDGERYYPERLGATRSEIFLFWKLFRAECSYPVRTRGTNNSVGIDYATDGVPLYDIYNASLDIEAPPNSPWAALNDNFGLELMGHMTRICELPSERFLFRYYIHDPWWINSPWYDRYDGYAHDIYLPMAISRISREGVTQSANDFSILSIDNSYGGMPSSCIYEPLPHILKAEKDAPDEPAPLVWVYPMREYTTSHDEKMLREMNEGDRYIMDAINTGLPLNCVCSTDSFLGHDISLYSKCVLLSPVPRSPEVLKRLISFARGGVPVILYGTPDALSSLPEAEPLVTLDTHAPAAFATEALARFGYEIDFRLQEGSPKPPTLTVARSDGGYFFSVYSADTTALTRFRFPLGAPILLGGETVLEDGFSTYHFARGEHRECRVFVKQASGVISCREAIPVSTVYRRKLLIRGLSDATVYLFPERQCEGSAAVADGRVAADATPVFLYGFRTVFDERNGTYLVGEHVTGDIYFMMGRD